MNSSELPRHVRSPARIVGAQRFMGCKHIRFTNINSQISCNGSDTPLIIEIALWASPLLGSCLCFQPTFCRRIGGHSGTAQRNSMPTFIKIIWVLFSTATHHLRSSFQLMPMCPDFLKSLVSRPVERNFHKMKFCKGHLSPASSEISPASSSILVWLAMGTAFTQW